MATDNHTFKSTHKRHNQAELAGAAPVLATSDSGPPPGAEPPQPTRTLEEAIEHARTLMLEVRALLRCLHEVLLDADDADSVQHAEVAYAAARWINESAEQLDLVKLRPLIEAVRQRGDATSGNDAGNYPYQVREPTVVYHAWQTTAGTSLCRRAECGGKGTQPSNQIQLFAETRL